MSGNTGVKLIDDNGIRIDGRKVDELRPIKIEAGVLKSADGSAYVEIGKNKVVLRMTGEKKPQDFELRIFNSNKENYVHKRKAV